jgi:hypothetical protein
MDKTVCTRTMRGLAALVVVVAGLWHPLVPLTRAAPKEQATEVHALLGITDARRNPDAPALAVAGVLTVQLDTKTGLFTGVLTPAVDATMGARFPTVLFQVLEGAIVPDLEVTQLAVDGQLNGRAMHLIVREVLGPNKHIFAMGTTLTAPEHQDVETFERAAGVGVGPELGAFEDQALWQLRVTLAVSLCVHVNQSSSVSNASRPIVVFDKVPCRSYTSPRLLVVAKAEREEAAEDASELSRAYYTVLRKAARPQNAASK